MKKPAPAGFFMGVDYRALRLAAKDIRSSPFLSSHLLIIKAKKNRRPEPAVLIT
ncbi:hypothetical protein AB8W28_19755 [Cronobacter universalis]|uniref:hypothetical protein n=1 Tax=Cronobacter universalis TaxID=535744 RepID=UPI000B23B40A|nr:hypothetical protein [Cronobacter universalis]